MIEFESGVAIRSFGHKVGEQFNVTVAEFEGLLHGLKRLESLKQLRADLSSEKFTGVGPTIIVQGDSETVIDLLLQRDSSKVKKSLKPLHTTAIKLLMDIGVSWKAERIPKGKNKECDGLAHAELEACLRESGSKS